MLQYLFSVFPDTNLRVRIIIKTLYKVEGTLRVYYTRNLKFTCFVCYLKIVNTVSKNIIHILKQIVQGTQKWH